MHGSRKEDGCEWHYLPTAAQAAQRLHGSILVSGDIHLVTTPVPT